MTCVDELNSVKIYRITISHENKEEEIYLLIDECEPIFLFPAGEDGGEG